MVPADNCDINQVFAYYDRSGDGRIDYKEFTSIFTSEGNRDQSAAEQTQQY